MAEHTNFYSVQRGLPQSFKPVSDGVIYLYLYINIHTDIGRSQETIFGYSLSETHPLLNFMLCDGVHRKKLRIFFSEQSGISVKLIIILKRFLWHEINKTGLEDPCKYYYYF